MRLLRRNSGPAALGRYWNALVDGQQPDDIERLAADLDPDVRETADLLHRASSQTRPAADFATHLHDSLLKSFRTPVSEAPIRETPPASSHVDDPIPLRPGRRVALAGHRVARLAAALLIVVVIGAGVYQLLPSGRHMATQEPTAIPSPTATPIVSTGAGAGINMVSADGQIVLNLSTDGAFEIDPAWSPDGAQIVFSTGDAIWVMNADGSGRRKIVATENRVRRPRWSPSGDVIAFLDSAGALYLVGSDGSNLRSIDFDTVPVTPAPTPEPATEALELAEPAAPDIDWIPTWSPDGQFVAAFAAEAGITRLFIVSADGSQVSHVASINGTTAGPAWSPDGASIAFFAEVSGGWTELVALDVETREATVLFETREVHTAPAWSPDGRKVLLVGGVAAGTLVNADGSGTTRFDSLPNDAASPVWSPDGSRIAFLGESGDVYVMNADGTELQRVAELRGAGQPPAWSPDGDWLLFSSQG
jgi:Tol biopolymer transport system component